MIAPLEGRNCMRCGAMKKIVFSVFILFCYLLAVGCKNASPRNIARTRALEASKIIRETIESKQLGKNVPFIIYLPKGYGDGTEYPVWYGLHSHGANERMWIDRGLALTADELIASGEIEPLIMVFPLVSDATLKEIEADFKEHGKFTERIVH